MSPRHKHVRVILTAGVLESLDEEHTKRVEADGTLKKPFEASALIAAVKPLAEAASKAREGAAVPGTSLETPEAPAQTAPFVAVVDAEQVRAAVTVALDASMEKMVEEITRRVLAALNTKKSIPEPTAVALEPPKPTLPSPTAPAAEPVRRVNPVRLRGGSILGLDLGRGGPDRSEPKPL
jgi:hypothetical protein